MPLAVNGIVWPGRTTADEKNTGIDMKVPGSGSWKLVNLRINLENLQKVSVYKFGKRCNQLGFQE